MSTYGLFLTFRFGGDGNFDDNTVQRIRRPDNRFWDMVFSDPANPDGNHFVTRSSRLVEDPNSPGTFIPETTRINADTRTMEMVAFPSGDARTDSVLFAVNLLGGGANPPSVTNIRFACSIHPGLRVSKSSVASPFRIGNEIQAHLSTPPTKFVSSIDPENPAAPPAIFRAIGPYPLVRDPGPPGAPPLRRECCFHKLTVVATAVKPGNPPLSREFAYDPDMDIEMGL